MSIRSEKQLSRFTQGHCQGRVPKRERTTLIGTNTITAETETATTTTQEAEEKTLGGEKNYVLYT